jgi:transketolase
MERKEGFDMDGEDLFFLKRSYISPVYSVLARSGYFPVSELATFRLINSRLQGHLQLTIIYQELELHLVHLDKVYL